jgi:hypothetical protein
MADAEYLRWVYPPDGGPGHVVQTPDERPKGWLEYPTEPAAATGERIIGQPDFRPKPEQPVAPPPTAEQLPADEDEDEPARKSKKK